MRTFQKSVQGILLLAAAVLLTGCSSSVGLGITSGLQAGVSAGVAAIVGGLLQALAGPALGTAG